MSDTLDLQKAVNDSSFPLQLGLKQLADQRHAATLAKFVRDDPVPWLARAQSHAQTLVIAHAGVISTMAAALLDQGELDARQICALWFQLQRPEAALLIADRERRAFSLRRAPRDCHY
jgi:hypothetical protein